MMMGDSNNCHIIPVHDNVSAVEFSPFDWSSSFLAVGTNSRVIVYNCKFKEEFPEIEDFCYEVLREFNRGSKVRCITWSPEASSYKIPKCAKFAAAGDDMNIHLIMSDLKNDDSVVVIEGHQDYINSITFEPEHGTLLASTSDDHTCRIWNLDGTLKTTLTLNSPGMAVCWHKEDSGKIMVAQKNGIIRFYNFDREQPIMSLDCRQTPLMSADWCPGNNLKVGGVAASSWFVWDISRSSQPQDSNQIHTDGAIEFRWCPNNQNLFAAGGRHRHQVKVLHYKQHQMLLNATLPIGSGMTWHYKLSVIAVVGDGKVHVWKLDPL